MCSQCGLKSKSIKKDIVGCPSNWYNGIPDNFISIKSNQELKKIEIDQLISLNFFRCTMKNCQKPFLYVEENCKVKATPFKIGLDIDLCKYQKENITSFISSGFSNKLLNYYGCFPGESTKFKNLPTLEASDLIALNKVVLKHEFENLSKEFNINIFSKGIRTSILSIYHKEEINKDLLNLFKQQSNLISKFKIINPKSSSMVGNSEIQKVWKEIIENLKKNNLINEAQLIIGSLFEYLDCPNKIFRIIFIMDSSNSMNSTHFQKSKNFIKSIVDKFGIVNRKYGLINFSSKVKIECELKKFNNKQEFNNIVDKMQQLNEYTAIGDALIKSLSILENEVKLSNEIEDDRISNIFILLTDGVNTHGKNVIEAIDKVIFKKLYYKKINIPD